MRPSEEELLRDLDEYDALVVRCARGQMSTSVITQNRPLMIV